MRLYTQLNFGGNCEEAFRFYEKHLGGKVTFMMRQDEAPNAPAGAGKAIIHARMTLGQTELIGNDVPPDIFKPIRSSYLYLSVASSEVVRHWRKPHAARTGCRAGALGGSVGNRETRKLRLERQGRHALFRRGGADGLACDVPNVRSNHR